jgi:folylpolyglutamate synthase/dihydropteroate synthase
LAILMLRTAGAPWSVTLDEANAGLAGVRLPGRFHREGRFIFDVAHNPDGASVLAATLKAGRVSRVRSRRCSPY